MKASGDPRVPGKPQCSGNHPSGTELLPSPPASMMGWFEEIQVKQPDLAKA